MKFVALLLAFIAAILGYMLYAQKTSHTKFGLEMQAKCAAQARVAFKDMGYKPDDPVGYANHYSEKLNKCFMKVEFSGPTPPSNSLFTHKHLLDAYEGKTYGDMFASWDETRNQPHMMTCKVTPLSGSEQNCQDEAEFDRIAEVYLVSP